MRSTQINSDSEKNTTFIGDARRQQLVEATISSVAEEGYSGASLAKVAKLADISKSVVVYHFRDKNQLIEETVDHIFSDLWESVRPKLETATSAKDQLRTFVEAEFAYMEKNRNRLLAVAHILENHRDKKGALYLRDKAEKSFLEGIGIILKKGQKNGEFRIFAVMPIAATIMHAINGILGQLAANPNLDLKLYQSELITLFDHATRKTVSHQ